MSIQPTTLQELCDREAIRDCLYRYSRGLDRHDDEVLYSAYHDDAIDHHGDFLGSPSEFVPWAHSLHEGQWIAHTHFVTNPLIEIVGDTAHAESYVLFALRRNDGAGVDLGGGRYIDRLERRNGTWRIAARRHVIEWQTRVGDAIVDRLKAAESGTPYPTGAWDHSDPSYARPLIVASADNST
jgi:hypothetical protein